MLPESNRGNERKNTLRKYASSVDGAVDRRITQERSTTVKFYNRAAVAEETLIPTHDLIFYTENKSKFFPTFEEGDLVKTVEAVAIEGTVGTIECRGGENRTKKKTHLSIV